MSPTAVERLALYFGALRTRQGLLARAALGTPDPGDEALAQALATAMSGELRPDGTVGGGALATIWRAHELLDLGRDGSDPALAAIIAWVLASQDRPGAYGTGCDKARHAQRVCMHYASGFFSPAPAEVRVAPITLPNGKVFRVEPAARFAISCLGLRALLRAGLGHLPAARQHVESLRLLSEQWTGWSGFFAPDAMVAGLHALALADAGKGVSVGPVVEMIAAHQGPDGLWNNTDTFAMLEALQATGLDAARQAAQRALSTLVARQRVDGTFGVMAQQERALIVLRAILWADPEL